jgi:DNA (cytosine-5)-methyltransferase 1
LRSGIFAKAFPAKAVGALTSFELSADAVEITKSFGRGLSKSPFENSGYYLNGTVTTVKTELTANGTKQNLGSILLPDDQVPSEFWIDEARLPEWQYLKGAKTIQRIHKESGTAFNYSEGKMAFPDSLDNPARTIITGEGGTSPSRFKHVIKTSNGYRRLTPIELERLNGFPDDWTRFDADGKEISDVRRAFFMGNALVIGVVEKIGHEIYKELAK